MCFSFISHCSTTSTSWHSEAADEDVMINRSDCAIIKTWNENLIHNNVFYCVHWEASLSHSPRLNNLCWSNIFMCQELSITCWVIRVMFRYDMQSYSSTSGWNYTYKLHILRIWSKCFPPLSQASWTIWEPVTRCGTYWLLGCFTGGIRLLYTSCSSGTASPARPGPAAKWNRCWLKAIRCWRISNWAHYVIILNLRSYQLETASYKLVNHYPPEVPGD